MVCEIPSWLHLGFAWCVKFLHGCILVSHGVWNFAQGAKFLSLIPALYLAAIEAPLDFACYGKISHSHAKLLVARFLLWFSSLHTWLAWQRSMKLQSLDSSCNWASTCFFMVLTWILPFLGTHIDWTLSLYSPEQFFDTRRGSSFSRYSHGFEHFSVLTLIAHFSGSHPNSSSILARILLFPGIHPDSSIFRNSHWLDPFPVLTPILPFFGTR